MRARPIQFNSDMVRASLDGRKTKTRRVVRPQPEYDLGSGTSDFTWRWKDVSATGGAERFFGSKMAESGLCPYGQSGDLLWVRETAYHDSGSPFPKQRPHDLDDLYYRADGDCCQQIPECACLEVGKPKWRPSIHMPRWASRLTLRITDVRVERVQDISEADAIAEGIDWQPGYCTPAVETFWGLWDSINANRKDKAGNLLPYSWDDNPWVWALTFEAIHQNVDQVMQGSTP